MCRNKTIVQYLNWSLRLCVSAFSFLLLVLCLVVGCQHNPQPLFQSLSPTQTGINFTNTITEDETHNILNFTNLYTGSGVGIADFDQDGLPDIFLGGNMESSRLYLNKGNLQFEDISQSAKIQTDRWITGVTIADVNTDGWQDIYLSVSGKATKEKRKNLLYINQGETKEGVQFTEQAEQYGIADTSQCTHANFFDYDKDGDLDLFVIVNPTDYALYNVNSIRRKKVKGEATSTDKLYRNNLVETGATTFTDVSKEAGILIEGYSLGVNVSDLNGDHYPDIYITNDFLTNDILYINNQDGTFTNRADTYFKHTSFASMGIDVADINNDGLPEVYVLDMFPEDNFRQKMIMGNNNYDRFQYMLKMGYEPQYSRNTLQLNNGDNTFSEIGQLAGVYQTDWSWSALFADYDNDGYKDLFVTNGFRRDLGNLDYINYQNNITFGAPAARKAKQLATINQQPGAQLPNYIFQNQNGLQFTKKSKEWGIDQPSYSHGAAFADLDNDGDLDLVVNNVSQPTFVYENTSRAKPNSHYLQIQLIGEVPNQEAIGTKVWLYANEQVQFVEHTPFRGYQSTVATNIHFGLGKINHIDSIQIQWYDNTWQTMMNVPIDKVWPILKSGSTDTWSTKLSKPPISFFKEQKQLLSYKHQEDLQVDFKSQLLLPHQHSKAGPPMTLADINGDGLQDVFIGGAAGQAGQFFIQSIAGEFQQTTFPYHTEREDTDCHFFDADNDGDMDLYVSSGGVVFSNKKDIYQDRLYWNDGKGQFAIAKVLPIMPTSSGCIAITDFDKDGDQDIFIGGRVTPKQYPTLPNSYLLENQNGIFKDITPSSLSKIGMVTSALWTDYDKDGDEDLMIAGEFMPITFFKNEAATIYHLPFTIHHSNGWWNCLAQGDFDKDGDMDYLAGNIGWNSDYRASVEEPLCVYAKDFDKNGSLDPVFAQYIEGKEHPIASRDQLIAQIAPIKVRFNSYKEYAAATLGEVLKRQEREGAHVLECYLLDNSYIENLGAGNFEIRPLAVEMQIAPINDFLVKDLNEDGHLDALAVGNNYATAVNIGRFDAFTGGLLVGNGQGNFQSKRGATIGMVADKDARRIVAVPMAHQELIVISNNSDSLQVFKKVQIQASNSSSK